MNGTAKENTIVVRFRIPESVMDRIRRISVKEHITITQALQRAVKQTSDQGYTDFIEKQGKI